MPYVLLLISLRDMPYLCPKGADLDVKPFAPSCPLTLPLYLRLPTEQAENQGPFPGGVASVLVKIQTVPIVAELFRGSKGYIEGFTGLTLLYEVTWRDVMHVLGQTLTPDSKTWVLGESTTFGDEWLERETRGKREHEIVLFPTGSHEVPITELLCWMYTWKT